MLMRLRRDPPAVAVLRPSADLRRTGRSRPRGQPQAGPTSDASDGFEGFVSTTPNEPAREGTQDLPVPFVNQPPPVVHTDTIRAGFRGADSRGLAVIPVQSRATEDRSPAQRPGIKISMDGKGRWVDNVFVERLWRSVKYEDVYLRAYATPTELRVGLDRYFKFYNTKRRHSALDRRTPDAVYFDLAGRTLAA